MFFSYIMNLVMDYEYDSSNFLITQKLKGGCKETILKIDLCAPWQLMRWPSTRVFGKCRHFMTTGRLIPSSD